MDDVAPQIKDSMFEDQLRPDTPDLLGTCVSIMNNDVTKIFMPLHRHRWVSVSF